MITFDLSKRYDPLRPPRCASRHLCPLHTAKWWPRSVRGPRCCDDHSDSTEGLASSDARIGETWAAKLPPLALVPGMLCRGDSAGKRNAGDGDGCCRSVAGGILRCLSVLERGCQSLRRPRDATNGCLEVGSALQCVDNGSINIEPESFRQIIVGHALPMLVISP
jgi:hypothetical protein